MARLLEFVLGFIIFFGSLALAGWLHENCIKVGEWFHNLVGFMELPLFGICFILWLMMLTIGLVLMLPRPDKIFDKEGKTE